MRRLVLLSLVFAIGLHAQDAPAVARMVNELTVGAAALEKALPSPTPLVRAVVPAPSAASAQVTQPTFTVPLVLPPDSEINRAALEALAKWTFTPGTLNGVPVDVLFDLTVNFRF